MKPWTGGAPVRTGSGPGERQAARIYAICHIDEENLKSLAGCPYHKRRQDYILNVA